VLCLRTEDGVRIEVADRYPEREVPVQASGRSFASPDQENGRGLLLCAALAIAATSSRKEQAWEFVKFAAGPIGQGLIGESGLFVPVLTPAVGSPGFAKAHSNIRNLDVLIGGPANSGYLPVTAAWERIDALMDRGFGPVLRGVRPATSLQTGLSHDVDEVLRSR